MELYHVTLPAGNEHLRSEYAEGETVRFAVIMMTDCNTTVSAGDSPVRYDGIKDGRMECSFTMPDHDVTVTVSMRGNMQNLNADPPMMFPPFAGGMSAFQKMQNGGAPSSPDKALSPDKTAPSPDKTPTPGRFCPECGAKRAATDRFCGSCGFRLIP